MNPQSNDWYWTPQSTHKVATAAFWHTFHHDGKISPCRWGWEGCTPTPFHYIYHHVQSCSVPYAPAERVDTLQSPYFFSTPMYSVLSTDWVSSAFRLKVRSHRRNVASSHIYNMVWLYRSPMAVGRHWSFTCFLPAFAAATRGGEGGDSARWLSPEAKYIVPVWGI
jgi:hypothetical protein